MIRSKIIADGAYLPSRVVSNAELMETVETSDEWIIERTGIKFRHIAAEDELTSDLAVEAVQNAFQQYDLSPDSLDGIIIATTTPDQIFPSTAAIVHGKLALSARCFCFDISAVCAGFVYALAIADSMIKSGMAKRIAVIGAETMSRVLDWRDRSTCILFGDGAGVMILEATEEDAGILGCNLFGDGASRDILKVDGGVSSGSMDAKILMNGREVFRNAVEKMASSSADLLKSLGLSTGDLTWVLPHQANQRILDAVADRLHLPKERLISTVERHANTSAASIALTYSESVRSGKINSGDLIMLSALGAGLAWGSLLLRV